MSPPLEVYRKFLKNRAPEAHQIFFLLLKFGSAIFGTIRWPVGVTGGHRWPPVTPTMPYGHILNQIFKVLRFS